MSSSACSPITRSRMSGSSRSASARPCCSPTPATPHGRRSRFAAALLHVANHAIFKTLLFLGAGALERAVGSLDLDHLGGLLRRMPWTGGAFLIGCMAIAGLPPLNGFASEWLMLQSLLHVAFRQPLGVALAGAVALAALAATAALALLCFVKVVGLVLLGPPRRAECAARSTRLPGCGSAWACFALMCVALGLVPGLVLPTLAGLAPRRGWRGVDAPRRSDPAGHRLLPAAAVRGRARGTHRGADRAARDAPRRAGADLGVRAAGRGGAQLDLGRVHKAAAARARGVAAPAPCDRGRAGRRDGPERHSTRATSRRWSTPPCTSRRSEPDCGPRPSPGACSRATCAPTPGICSGS